jgi:uncharacterized cupin superfamily protein
MDTGTGGKKVGCSQYEVRPGQSSFPPPAPVYVIEGEGVLKVGDEEKAVRAGDFIPPSSGVTQILTNTSDDKALRYLCFSAD